MHLNNTITCKKQKKKKENKYRLLHHTNYYFLFYFIFLNKNFYAEILMWCSDAGTWEGLFVQPFSYSSRNPFFLTWKTMKSWYHRFYENVLLGQIWLSKYCIYKEGICHFYLLDTQIHHPSSWCIMISYVASLIWWFHTFQR